MTQSTKRCRLSIYFVQNLLFFIQDIHRHWTSNFDMELTIAYNSILFMSNITQEYVDHPASILFIINSFFLKFLNILNIYELKNLNELNNENRSINKDLNDLIFWIRVINIFLCSAFAAIFYKILKFKTSNLVAFIFTLTFIFSATFLNQASQVRSELLCVLFIFLGINSLTEFFKNKNRLFNLFFFFIFFYLSTFMKTQIIFYVPLLILVPFYAINTVEKFNLITQNYKFMDSKILLSLLYIFVILLILIFANKDGATLMSKLFLLSFYIFLNLIFLTYLYFLSNNIVSNLFVFNVVILISSFIFFSILLLHPSTSDTSEVSGRFFNFMYIRVYSHIPFNVDEGTWIINFIHNFIDVIPHALNSIFIKLKDYSILFFALLAILILNLKKINKKLFFSIIVILVYVIYSLIISNFRYYENNEVTYDLFFLPFLILILVETLSIFKNRKIVISISVVILISTIIINNKIIFYKMHPNNQEKLFCSEVSTEYLNIWHKHLSKVKVEKFCSNLN